MLVRSGKSRCKLLGKHIDILPSIWLCCYWLVPTKNIPLLLPMLKLHSMCCLFFELIQTSPLPWVTTTYSSFCHIFSKYTNSVIWSHLCPIRSCLQGLTCWWRLQGGTYKLMCNIKEIGNPLGVDSFQPYFVGLSAPLSGCKQPCHYLLFC